MSGVFSRAGDTENDFHQRVADQSIQSLEDRQDEIRRAKNGFIGMLAGIVVGGVVGWLFLGPADNMNQNQPIPVIRRPVTPAKVLPNDPGGMEIDNQDREIYHIVEKKPKPIGEVNIRPAPDTPKLDIKPTMSSSEAMENLVASIDEDDSLDVASQNNIKLASRDLEPVRTNSAEKVTIPEKIKEIDIKVQDTVNSASAAAADKADKKDIAPVKQETVVAQEKPKPDAFAKGTWYTQIIASSSRKSVQSLWNKLSAKHTFLKEYPHEIEEIKTAAGSTLYRLKVGSFKTREDAAVLGNKLKQNKISSIIKQN